jgi:NAD(P)H-dependent FMN reductase
MEPGTVLLIMGSTRASRICPKITEWIAEMGRARTRLVYEIVDLANWPLPMDDEPDIPAKGVDVYVQAHTRAWSDKIKSANAVIFVTPQYNWGYPAVLKNAIDHLYHEWHNKPAVIVTYGGHGGGKCAEQLRQVAGAVEMRVVPTAPGIVLPKDVIRHGAPCDPARDFKQHVESIENAFTELVAQMGATSGSRAPGL